MASEWPCNTPRCSSGSVPEGERERERERESQKWEGSERKEEE